jgi:elongation factor 2
MRRACYAASLLADPRLQEPVLHGLLPSMFVRNMSSKGRCFLLAEIKCPVDATQGVYSCLSQHRGQVLDETKSGLGVSTVTIKADLPVSESFDFTEKLRSHTNGQAFMKTIFGHWKTMKGCE